MCSLPASDRLYIVSNSMPKTSCTISSTSVAKKVTKTCFDVSQISKQVKKKKLNFHQSPSKRGGGGQDWGFSHFIFCIFRNPSLFNQQTWAGKAMSCSTKTVQVTLSIFPQLPSKRCHAQRLRDNESIHGIYYVEQLHEILNDKGFKKNIFGSKVMAILPYEANLTFCWRSITKGLLILWTGHPVQFRTVIRCLKPFFFFKHQSGRINHEIL